MYQKIMIIDDEMNILHALNRELMPWATETGTEIIACNGPKQALQMLEELAGQVDLIISDLRMPEMSGSDLLIEIKGLYPNILAILLSGYSEIGEVLKTVKAGVFSYIQKPWESEFLLAEVHKAMDVAKMRFENFEFQQRMERELIWAGEMQRTLLSVRIPVEPRLAFELTYQPLPQFHCGGDYYDIISLSQHEYLVLIGDVAGHGLTGALVTGILKSIIFSEYVRVHQKDFSPRAFLAWLNRRMAGVLRKNSNIIITFAAVKIDLQAMTMHWASAGHNPPLLQRAGFHALQVTGPAFGMMDEAVYEEKHSSLHKGDCLWLYTDALIELKNAEIAKGTTQLIEAISNSNDCTHQAVISKVLELAGAKAYADDLTLISCRLV